jgi:hypothetical protein
VNRHERCLAASRTWKPVEHAGRKPESLTLRGKDPLAVYVQSDHYLAHVSFAWLNEKLTYTVVNNGLDQLVRFDDLLTACVCACPDNSENAYWLSVALSVSGWTVSPEAVLQLAETRDFYPNDKQLKFAMPESWEI